MAEGCSELVEVETGTVPLPVMKDTGRVVPKVGEVPNWNVAEAERASIVPFSVVPLRKINPTGEVTGAASRAIFKE